MYRILYNSGGMGHSRWASIESMERRLAIVRDSAGRLLIGDDGEKAFPIWTGNEDDSPPIDQDEKD